MRDERKNNSLARKKKHRRRDFLSVCSFAVFFSLFPLLPFFALLCFFRDESCSFSRLSLCSLFRTLFLSLSSACLPQASGRRTSDVSRHQLYLLLLFLTTTKNRSLSLTLSHSFSYYVTHNNAKRSISHDDDHAQGVLVPILPRGEDDDFDEED